MNAAAAAAPPQVKYILGVSVARRNPVHDQLADLVGQLGNVKWQEVVMGLTIVLWLIAFKLMGKSKRKVFKYIAPLGPLTACIIGIAAVYIGGIDKRGIKIVGNIPKGGSPSASWQRPASAQQAHPGRWPLRLWPLRLPLTVCPPPSPNPACPQACPPSRSRSGSPCSMWARCSSWPSSSCSSTW